VETTPPIPTPPTPIQTCYRHPERRAGVRCQRCERPICPSCMTSASVGFHCPDCARGGAQKVYTRATLDRLNRPIVTQVLVAVNAAVFVLGQVRGSAFEVDFALIGEFLLPGGQPVPGFGVAGGEWYRVITGGFLHANVVHLLFNMVALFSIGRILEPVLGRVRFVTLYFVSLICGSLGVLALDPHALTVGASGAVFGLLGAMVIAQRSAGIDPWASGLGLVIGINLLLTFTIPGISIGGHIGGLVGGLVAGWVLLEGPRTIGSEAAATGAVLALGAAAFVGCLAVV
jgi:membrane associated rhomboid family serine protease